MKEIVSGILEGTITTMDAPDKALIPALWRELRQQATIVQNLEHWRSSASYTAWCHKADWACLFIDKHFEEEVTLAAYGAAVFGLDLPFYDEKMRNFNRIMDRLQDNIITRQTSTLDLSIKHFPECFASVAA